jgi:dihydrofolate reductase
MRQVRYGVAMSLDGYIAGPNGEADWIVIDPDIDFTAIFNRFDTLLVGRKTYDVMNMMGAYASPAPDVQSVIVSRTMRQADYPNLKIVSDVEPFVTALKARPGKDVWLFGGGALFHCLLCAGLVDGIDVAVMPTLLGGGIPLLPSPAPFTRLSLRSHRVYEKTGIIGLEYQVSQSHPGTGRPVDRQTRRPADA